MKRLKMMLMAMVAVFAIGAVSAAAANAAGSATITVDGNPCDVLFDSTSWVPTSDPPDPPEFVPGWKTDVSNVSIDPGGTCGVDTISGSGTIYKNAAGEAYFEGTFDFRILFNLVGCRYTGWALGTWTLDSGPPARKILALEGEADRVMPPSSSLCPANGVFTLDGWVDA